MPNDAPPGSPEKILILGGTKEAAELARELVAKGLDVTTSLAGRTREPAPLDGKVRIGGFGGAEGLAAYLTAEGFTRVIDATHPFARTISANAVKACEIAARPLDIRTRAPWQKQPGDIWIEVPTLEDAAAALPANTRVLLALGRQYLDAFSARSDCHFVIRMVDPPESPLAFASHTILTAKPSPNPDEEAALLRTHAITHLVCRNSGGDGAYAKIVAARTMGLPVVMVGR
ncbi:cobalt-precorrin-6A reductase [Rhizobium sp. C4]|uniref:cobalt-precorrin-6A reductase n=1 Tax=Rhizobium sp. C4 TaxID=1349800 RepID=UPI001E5B11BF|nr:cobalt-precorrin-6A reductase [Rhizobium sp. C4]MCD2173320.1 cobalt-precorrin-6A reductase [Rhizobium sp. C4]